MVLPDQTSFASQELSEPKNLSRTLQILALPVMNATDLLSTSRLLAQAGPDKPFIDANSKVVQGMGLVFIVLVASSVYYLIDKYIFDQRKIGPDTTK